MNDFNWILALFRVIGVLVMMSAAVFACWVLSGRQLPKHTSGVFGWLLLIVLWGLGGYAFTSRYALGLAR